MVGARRALGGPETTSAGRFVASRAIGEAERTELLRVLRVKAG